MNMFLHFLITDESLLHGELLKYYDDKHYSEVDIALYNTRESMKYSIDNIIDVDFNGILLKDNLLIHGFYIKVW